MKEIIKSVLKLVLRVVIMASIIHSGVTIITLLTLTIWNANSVVSVGCLLGGILTIIVILIISYFVANMLVEEQGSKVSRIFLRPLCLIFIGLILYFLLAQFFRSLIF